VLISSIAAKLFSTTLTYPQQMLQIAAQCNTKNTSLMTSMLEIKQKSGFKGFYRGLAVEFMRTLPQTALTFLIYESLRNRQNFF
jgi:solute carrier family 25 folate transporter 32